MAESRTSSRPIQSCFQCRKRKIKCSKSYPCTPCILRGEGEACREVDRNSLHDHKRSVDRLEELVDRVQKLESTISVLSTRGSPSQDASPRSIRRRELSSSPYSKSPSQSPKRPLGRLLDSPVPTTVRDSTPAEEIVMMLENIAMGQKAGKGRAMNDFNVSSSDRDTFSSTNLQSSHPWSLFMDSRQDVLSHLLYLLPTENQIHTLLNFYIQRINWYNKVIHAPTFMAEANLVLSHIAHQRHHLINIDFLGVLLMVLCLSLHFSDSILRKQLFLDNAACWHYSSKLYNGAQACLQYANYTASHTLEHLQTILLMGIYQRNYDEADSHWAMTGTAIKIAQNLGMSRLGSETGTRQYPPEWQSSIRREIARRIWWCLVFDDWSHAMAHQGTYSIHPSQNHTSLPANLDDTDLVETDIVQSKPLNVYTEMSSLLYRLRLVELYRQTIDEVNFGGYELDFALEMEAKVNNVIGDMKFYFKIMDDSQNHIQFSRSKEAMIMERMLCQMMGQTRLLRLHRPFLFQGYDDNRYAHSRDQCVMSAQIILQCLATSQQAEMFLRWWIVVFYSFTAVIILFIDLCYLHRDGTEAQIRERRQEIQEALSLFSSTTNTSGIVHNARNLLENLLDIETTMFSADSNIRYSSEDDTCFEQVVKRIIMDTSNGGGSNIASQALPLGEFVPLDWIATTTPPAKLSATSEPLGFLDINKITHSTLMTPDIGLFNGLGMQFGEASAHGLSDFLHTEHSSVFFS